LFLRRWLSGFVDVSARKALTGATAVAIISIFVMLGVWHGVGGNFAVYGLSQGLGVLAVHLSTLAMKKRLGKRGFEAYRANNTFKVIGILATYSYFAVTLFLFANSFDDMRRIFQALV
jgi:D-alanyl-lipoteichoic acid acyltransferase DltB (MBOAT superfamily)